MTTALDVPAIYRPKHQQRLFRQFLDCMARPGSVADLAAWTGGAPAALAVLAALCDSEVLLADPQRLLTGGDWDFLECRQSAVEEARFIFVDGTTAPDVGFEPALGTLTTPEQGATIVIRVSSLGTTGQLGTTGHKVRLSGPGIASQRELGLGTLHPGWLDQRAVWCRFFPLGVDLVVCDESRVAALPRTTRVTQMGMHR
ncbi:MAG: phosphonate C-P lyase system protein PhnH [Hyphomicrobiaceae bacterium]